MKSFSRLLFALPLLAIAQPVNVNLLVNRTTGAIVAPVDAATFASANGLTGGGGGSGTVTSIPDGSTNGVTWTVATRTTTPTFTFSLGAITPSSVAATGAVSGTTGTFSALTATRVPFAGTAGLLGDSSTFLIDAGKFIFGHTASVGNIAGQFTAAAGFANVASFSTRLTTAGAIDFGPQILFPGHNGSTVTNFGAFGFKKENATAGDGRAYWILQTPDDTGTLATRIQVSSTGILQSVASTDFVLRGGNSGGATLTLDDATTAAAFNGALTASNLSGTNTGDQTSVSGNAGTATALATTRTIGGSNFDGMANVTSFPVPGAIGGTTPATGAFTTISGTTGTFSSLTSGRVPFVSTAGLLVDSSVFTFSAGTLSSTAFAATGDIATSAGRLGAGTAAPESAIHAQSTTITTIKARSSGAVGAGRSFVQMFRGGTGTETGWDWSNNLSLANDELSLREQTSGSGAVRFSMLPGGAATFTSSLNAASLTLGTPLAVAQGGIGANTVTGSLIGNGTSAVTAATSSTVGQVYRVTGSNTFAFGAVDLADTDAVTGVLPAANQGGVMKIAVFSVDGGGAAIATGTVAGTARIPFACTLTGYSITATAATGTNTIKIWLKATATTIPTISDVINTSGVSLTTGTAVASATLTDFTDTVYAAGDMARCAVTAVDGAATDLTVTLYGTRL